MMRIFSPFGVGEERGMGGRRMKMSELKSRERRREGSRGERKGVRIGEGRGQAEREGKKKRNRCRRNGRRRGWMTRSKTKRRRSQKISRWSTCFIFFSRVHNFPLLPSFPASLPFAIGRHLQKPRALLGPQSVSVAWKK